MATRLLAEFDAAKKSVHIESAYFVVRDEAVERVRRLTDRGVEIRVLTNSLASNNVLAAHTGHAKYRDDLLEAGMVLYELRPDAEAVLRQVAPQGKAAFTTLHAKTSVIDDEKAFVGSFNLDPRSAEINSEIGIMIDSPVFARQVKAFVDEGVLAENAYRVRLDDNGRLRWETVVDGQRRTWSKDPATTFSRRFVSGAIGILPIQNQL